MQGMGLRACAKKLGVSHVRLLALANEGRVPRYDDGSFDLDAVRAAFSQSADPSRQSKINGTADENIGLVGNLTEIRIKREMLKAQLDAFQVALKEGKLIWAEDAEHAWQKHIESMKSLVLLAIDEIAPKVAPLGTVEECRAVLFVELRAMLTDASTYKAGGVAA